MADPTFEAERLAEIMRQVNEDLLRYGQVTSTTTDAMMKAKYGIENFTPAMSKAGDAVGELAKAGLAAANAMLEGKKGAAAFNDSLTSLSMAATAAGAALGMMVPVIGPLVSALVLATTATIAYVKKSNEMADKLYGGFNKLGKAGAVGAEGLTGVYQGAKKLGLSMSELDGYVSMIGENSRDLALLSGSVYRGRQQFEDMGAAMEPFRESLFAAGMNQQDINEASMQYLRLQTRIGATQNLTVNQLAEGARKYLIETDALTKLTGQSRKEQEEALEAARSQQRFRAKLEEMRNSGDAQQVKAADELELTYKMLYHRSKEAAQGFGDLSTGMIGTDAANKLTQSTQADVLDTLERQKRGQIDGIKAFQEVGQSVARVTKQYNMLYQTGVGEETLLKINEGTELGLAANRDLAEEAAKIRQEQIDQGLTGKKAVDGITQQYGENVKQQQDLNKKMEDAVFKGISNALSITKKLGNVTNTLADQFTTLSKAINGLLRALGLGVKSEETTAAEKAQETAKSQFDKEMEGATPLQKMGIGRTDKQKAAYDAYRKAEADAEKMRAKDEMTARANEGDQAAKDLLESGYFGTPAAAAGAPAGPGAAPGATPAAPTGGAPAGGAPAAPGAGAAPVAKRPSYTPPSAPAAGAAGAAAPLRPEDLLLFGGESGSLSSFNQLDANLRDAVLSAGEDYLNITGKKLQINSAVRDRAKQQKLYDDWINSGKKGVPVAPPGSSLHESGQAVDINNHRDRYAVAFLNQEGLYQRVAGDPPHFQFGDGGVVTKSTYAEIGEKGPEAVIPLKGGAVPVDLKNFDKFAEKMGMHNFLKSFLVPSMPNMEVGASDEALESIESFKRSAIEAAGSQLPEMIAKLEEMRLAADRQTEIYRPMFEKYLSGDADSPTIEVLTELLKAQQEQNDISSRLLQAANN